MYQTPCHCVKVTPLYVHIPNLSNCLFFIQIYGLDLNIELKTKDWPEQVDKEIALCTPNTLPLYDFTKGDYNCKIVD